MAALRKKNIGGREEEGENNMRNGEMGKSNKGKIERVRKNGVSQIERKTGE